MPRKGVPYGDAVCSLKERIAELFDLVGEKLHSINGVQGDGKGDVKIISGDDAVVITNDQIGHKIEVSLADSVVTSEGVKAAVDAEATARASADSALRASIGDNASAISAETSARESAVSAEASARQEADSALQTAIDAEASARASADSALRASISDNASAISAETSARESAVSAEASARASADDALRASISDNVSAISAETSARESAVSAEASARAKAVSDEASTRASADSALQTAVDGKAPIAHASTGTEYGVGSATQYGHVRVDTALSSTSTNPIQNKAVQAALAAKQGTLTWDTAPTAGSANPVTSGGIKTAMADYVKKSGAAQTVTSQIMVPTTATGTRDTQIANGTRIQNDLDNYATMVRTANAQTIGGKKTFTSKIAFAKSNDSEFIDIKRTDINRTAAQNSYKDVAKIRIVDTNGSEMFWVDSYVDSGDRRVLQLEIFNSDGTSPGYIQFINTGAGIKSINTNFPKPANW